MPKKILLADDSVTIQKVVELTFVDGDYEVTSVSNGKLAVQKLKEDRPDILLCDVIMPEMNGYEVAAFVKRNPGYAGIPVILLTGTFEPFDEEKAKACGADLTITKPFDSKMLVEKVDELIRKRMVFSPEEGAGPVQVFHSRQEFTLQEPPEEEVSPASPPLVGAPAPSGEAEFLMPPEPELPVLEDTATSSGAGAPPPATTVFEPLEPPAEIPSEASAASTAPLAAETPPSPVEPFEGFDLDPVTEEPLTEADFKEVVPPPEPSVDLGPSLPAVESDQGIPEPREEAAAPLPPFAEEPFEAQVESAVPLTEQVSGPTEVSAAAKEETTKIVHALTEQQEMVSEAHHLLDHKPEFLEAPPEEAALAPAPEEAFAPPPEPVTGAFPQLSEEPPREAFTVETPLPEAALEEAPAEETEEASGEERPIKTGVPPVLREEAIPAPDWEGAVRSAVETLVPGQVALAVAQSLPAAIPAAVEEALREILPSAARQAVEEALPPAMERSLAEVLPPRAASAAAEVAEAEVHRRLSEEIPFAARRAAEESVPAAIQEVAERLVAPAVARETESRTPAAVSEAVSALVPPALRQALETQAPELVREALEESLPALVREEVGRSLPQLAAEEVKAQVEKIVREIAWEVIPELAESLIRRRIQELEAEAG